MLSRALASNDPFETMVCVVSGKKKKKKTKSDLLLRRYN